MTHIRRNMPTNRKNGRSKPLPYQSFRIVYVSRDVHDTRSNGHRKRYLVQGMNDTQKPKPSPVGEGGSRKADG